MGTRQPIGTAGFFLLIVLLAAFVSDAAAAQTRWPPWQSYGEAERVRHVQQKRQAVPTQSEIDALNKRVEQLRQSGKQAEAIAAAKQALSLTERRYGANHVATAAALTRLAELLIAQKRYAEAEPLLKRALAIHEKGNDRVKTAQAANNLAKLYQREGRKADAKQLEDRAIALSGGKGPTALKKVPMAKVQEERSPRATSPSASTPREERAERREGGGFAAQSEARAKAMAEAEARARAQAEAERYKTTAEAQREQESARAMKPKARAYHRKAAPEAAAPGGSGSAAATPPAPEAMARSRGPTAKGAEAPEGAARARGLVAPEQKWDVEPVFFGTDRAEEANPKRLSYGSDRGRRLEIGRALVTIPKLHQVPQIERPWAIRIPYFDVTIYEQAEDPNKHFTMQEIKRLSKDDFLSLVRQRLAGSARFKDQALVFVHGFNTSFDNAVYRTAQIAYDLKFDGVPFLYSWPSGGAVASYTYDRESAEASKPYMRQFLEMVVHETGAKSVSIIAHSMGNQPLLDVLKDMKSAAPEGVAINQVILAAPDVDADSFTELAEAINGLAKGVTLYAASNDRALIVSRNFWGHYRAGDVPAQGPLVLPGVDTIDVTAASTDVFALNHSDYAESSQVLDDIGELIRTGKRPPEDRILKPERITTDRGPYWRYDGPTNTSSP